MLAESVIATLLRLRGATSKATLSEIKGIAHQVGKASGDPQRIEAWLAICRIGDNLDRVGLAATPLWDDAIRQTKEWLHRLG